MLQQGAKSLESISYGHAEQWGIVLQLLVSHMLVAGITLGLCIWLPLIGLSNILVPEIILLLGSSLGWLFTWNIRYTLCLLAVTLQHLSHGHAVELSEHAWWYWPFTESFAALIELDRELKQYLEQIQLSREYRLRLLQQASYEADLEQRHYLARALHEKITQHIFSIRLNVAIMQAQRDRVSSLDESMQTALEAIQHNTEDAQFEMQALQLQLRAALLDHEDLATALQTLIHLLGYHTGAALQLTLGELPDGERLPRSMQEIIFRIVQEACDNIAKHAYAQHIWFMLEQREQTLLLKIRDDGQGFDPTQVSGGTGLAHIHERIAELKGTISLRSQIGQGTTLQASIPLLHTLAEQRDQQVHAWTIRHNLTQIHAHIQIGEWSALATLMLIALYGHYGILLEKQLCCAFILLLSLASTAYGYLYAYIGLAQMKLATREHGEDVQVQLRLRGWHLWKYRLTLAGIWYLLTCLHEWRNERFMLELAIASCGLLVLLIREHGLELYAKRQQYMHLPQAETRWQLQCWRQTLARQSKGWLLCFGAYLLSLPALYGAILPPGHALLMFYDAPALILVCWGVQLLLETLVARRIGSLLLNAQESTRLCATDKEVRHG